MKIHIRKRCIALLGCLTAICFGAKAQIVVSDPSNLAQSIVNAAEQMQYTSSTAQTAIENLQKTREIFQGQREFFDQFKVVSRAVKGAKKLQEAIQYTNRVLDLYVDFHALILSSKNLSAREVAALGTSYAVMLRRTAGLVIQLREAVSGNLFHISDGGRMDLITRIYDESEQLCALMEYFSRKVLAVLRLRDEARFLRRRLRDMGAETEQLNF